MNGETSFGEWLRQQRKSLDLTQEVLADKIGCSRDTVRKVELGIRRPSRQVAELLAECFGVPAEQRQAFLQFARGSAGQVSLFVSTASPMDNNSSLRLSANPPNNLPAASTPFIGRKRELEKLSALVMRDGVRMVTLTGPGGIGKTRLALRVAEGLLEDFEDGVFFVPLASIRDPEFFVSALSQVLGVRETGERPLLDTLKLYLRGKQMLLLLDNFEQIISASLTVADLLTASSGLKVLVTSRELLGLQSEYTFSVPPLDTPDTKHLEPIDRLTQYEAVRLFIERAIAVKPDFAVTNDNAPAVAQICVRLDGLPLAIELAAARSRLFSPQIMLVQLQDRLKVLTGGARDLPLRHQTLRNTIQWSYDLLNEGEKQLFNRISVFQGGITIESLTAVCYFDVQLQVDPLTCVESLMSKNLLQQREGVEGEPRFQMLETIHEYAREKAEETGETLSARRHHTAYFLKLAERTEPLLQGPQQRVWYKRLLEEQDNLRASLHWALDSEQVETVLRFGGALWRFWDYYALADEGLHWLESALSVMSNADIFVQAKALRAAGSLAFGKRNYEKAKVFHRGSMNLYRELTDTDGIASELHNLGLVASFQHDYVEAKSLYEESLVIRRERADKNAIAYSLHSLAHVYLHNDDYGAARSLFLESLSLRRELNNPNALAETLHDFGVFLFNQCAYDSARRLLEESVTVARVSGDANAIAHDLIWLGRAACHDRQYSSAQAFIEQGLAIFLERKDKNGIAWSWNFLGEVAFYEGNLTRAKFLLEEALGIFREIKSKWGCAKTLLPIGHNAYRQGDYKQAESSYRESMVLFGDVGYVLNIFECWVALGRAALAQEQLRRAACLFGAAENLVETAATGLESSYMAECRRELSTARAQLDQVIWQSAWAEGRTMSMEQAIAYALDEG